MTTTIEPIMTMSATVFFVDDERKLPEYYIKKLRSKGFEVEFCRSVSDAKKRIQEHPRSIHGFVLDIMMPHEQEGEIDDDAGLGLYRWIRDRSPTTPIAILTNRFPEDLFESFPVDDHLRVLWKPGCSPVELAEVLHGLIWPET